MLRHIRSGDCLTLMLGCLCVVLLTMKLWSAELADKALIRSGGKIFREVPLSRNQRIEVPGPLGVSVVAIEATDADFHATIFFAEAVCTATEELCQL